MKTKLFLFPLIGAMILSSCGGNPGSGAHGKPDEDPITKNDVFMALNRAGLKCNGMVQNPQTGYKTIDTSTSFNMYISRKLDNDPVFIKVVQKDANKMYIVEHSIFDNNEEIHAADYHEYYEFDTNYVSTNSMYFLANRYYIYPSQSDTYKVSNGTVYNPLLDFEMSAEFFMKVASGDFTFNVQGDSKVSINYVNDSENIDVILDMENLLIDKYDRTYVMPEGKTFHETVVINALNSQVTLPTDRLYHIPLAEALTNTRNMLSRNSIYRTNFTMNWTSDYKYDDDVYYHPYRQYIVDDNKYYLKVRTTDDNNRVIIPDEEAFFSLGSGQYGNYFSGAIKMVNTYVQCYNLVLGRDIYSPIELFNYALRENIDTDLFTETETPCHYEATISNTTYHVVTDGEQYVTNNSTVNKNIYIEIFDINRTNLPDKPSEDQIISQAELLNKVCDNFNKAFEYDVKVWSYRPQQDTLRYEGYKVQVDNSQVDKEVIKIIEPDNTGDKVLVYDKSEGKRYSYTSNSNGGYDKREINETQYKEAAFLYYDFARNEVETLRVTQVDQYYRKNNTYDLYLVLMQNFTGTLDFPINDHNYGISGSYPNVTVKAFKNSSYNDGQYVSYTAKNIAIIDSIEIPA